MNPNLNRPRRSRCGFTLVELLVVVLVLSVLMAVAAPLYVSTVSDSRKKTCRANMQTIANTVQAARVRTNAADYGALITAGVTTTSLTDLQAVPVCPNAGAYTLAQGTSAADLAGTKAETAAPPQPDLVAVEQPLARLPVGPVAQPFELISSVYQEERAEEVQESTLIQPSGRCSQ